jgi:glycerol-3-phosphate dehydrogenase subunit C
MTLQTLRWDHCLKCNICTAACPVVAFSDNFLGPKAVGPQSERFRHPRLTIPDDTVELCSGCGTCSQVCPHGVSVAEINIRAKARRVAERRSSLRDQLISRPEVLGVLGSRFAHVANAALGSTIVRWMLQAAFGINRRAPLPEFSSRPLRKRLPNHCVTSPSDVPNETARTVAYFHGCTNNYYEPALGELAVSILETLGLRVILPPQVCCGLPLQSNGLFPAARRYARKNLALLSPFAEEGIAIIGTSTSCTLALKHEYRAVLGLRDPSADTVSASTYDFFEYLTQDLAILKRLKLEEVRARAYYHPPCQLRSHGIGTPALDVLQRIPNLNLEVSKAACCGIAGTYGVKKETYPLALEMGEQIISHAKTFKADFIISDSESCRWWLSKHANLPAYHPLEILARSMGKA